MKSIRLQLPFSYAAIALLATLALGALMLIRLNDYYSQHEVETMHTSAQAIQAGFQMLDLAALPADVLQAQVESFAYFARSRVRVYAPNGALLADSGEVSQTSDVIHFSALPALAAGQESMIFFESGIAGQAGLAAAAKGGTASPDPQTFGGPGLAVAPMPAVPAVIYTRREGQAKTLPVFTIAFSGGLNGFEEYSGARSVHSVELPLTNQAGQPDGRLVVSGGPAYGRQIVNSVAQAWALAGVLAVILAAAAGWLASRRITRPVLALAAVTGRMAAGDLSARADEWAGQEFAALGRSFNEMAGQVETTIRALRRFAADAAHELKTPLTALRTDLELADGENNPARLSQLLDRAREQVLELDRLTVGLLDLSRLEAGAAELELERLDLCELARQTCERYAARAEQAGQDFKLDLPPGEIFGKVNRSRLALALGNLLENALKFTPGAGQVRLAIAKNQDRVELVVEDDGIGIPPEDLPVLFERFHRGRNTAGYPGSGLGLAIVRAVAEAHGGAARAENRPEGGARFTIELPADDSGD